jgi:putative colanic acid biosysnthesis UDP-glucose lipid carrier transferase
MNLTMTSSLTLTPGRPGLVYRSGKRIFDLTASAGALFMLAPLLIVVAAAIRRDSDGKVLFRQLREGHHGAPFRIFKFRTMVVRQDDDTLAFTQTQLGDPRVTRVGAYLRRSSFDELPQLLNTFGGSMSLVGPRPHVPALSARFASRIEGYDQRLAAKPGLTGLAQVSGCRGETETVEKMAARVRLDRDYVAHPSLLADVRICLRTLRTALGNDDAY